jgi:hypothetical protein
MLPRRCFSSMLGLIALASMSPGYSADLGALAADAHSAARGVTGDPTLALPAFRPGMWEYRRTQVSSAGGKPQTATLRKCSDPSAEFKQKLAELKQKGCVFSPMKQNGRRYEASWRCAAPDGSIRAMRDIITVNSDTSYVNESEARASRRVTHSTIVATRQGDCPTPTRLLPPPAPDPAGTGHRDSADTVVLDQGVIQSPRATTL